ncbi:MAG: inositol monophosphatase family protein [Halobacteria archaeon]
MHGRRLATTEEIIVIRGADEGDTYGRLENWCKENDVNLKSVEVGESIEEIHRPERQTLGITFGGDGTFLEGIKVFGPRAIPIIGVNMGTLAFLARIEPRDLTKALEQIVRGRASVEDRQQVHVRTDEIDATGINDVIIQHKYPEEPVDRKISRIHAFADREYMGMYEGNGVVVSTPTGSTGIAMSANGPIHYPKNNFTMEVVPMDTHQIGVSPVVLGGDTDLRMVTEDEVNLLIDGGRTDQQVEGGEPIYIEGADNYAHIVKTDYDDRFFTSITKKLGWSIRGDDDDGPRHLVEPESDGIESVVERSLDLAKEVAESVGEPLRELHGQVESIHYKTDKANVVTEADYQSQNIITTAIENEFPHHGIVSEESVNEESSSEYTWMIDPLDGTGNFAHGNPNYSVSIALLKGDYPVMGVVYAPETGEMFWAIQGGEAYERDSLLKTTQRSLLDESMLLSGYDPDGTFLSNFYHETRGVRRLGSAALNLCYLASGTADAVWEYDTRPWDIAAGLVIARTAGAKITDSKGERYSLSMDYENKRTELLGSNGPLHSKLLDGLKDVEGLES